jgi:hypothetical protein
MNKKIIIITLLMSWMLLSGIVFGDEVTIQGPQGGTYSQGSDMTIQWDYTILSVPIPTNPIHRRMYVKVGSPSNPPGDFFAYDFAADITAQSYTWNVDKPPGTYVLYFLISFTEPSIRITSQPFVIDETLTVQVVPNTVVVETVLSETVVVATPAPQSIGVKPGHMVALANRIAINSPETGKNYYIGGTVPIQWSKAKIQNYGYVWLQVCYPDGQAAAGAYTTSNTGNYDWELKEKTGGSYRIKVWTHDKKYAGISGVFHIKHKLFMRHNKSLRQVIKTGKTKRVIKTEKIKLKKRNKINRIRKPSEFKVMGAQ